MGFGCLNSVLLSSDALAGRKCDNVGDSFVMPHLPKCVLFQKHPPEAKSLAFKSDAWWGLIYVQAQGLNTQPAKRH